MDWTFAFWIILTGSFVAASCAMLGCFLVLRRQAMLSDAISHSILLGIVLAFWITGSLDAWWMILGSVFVGVLTTYIVQLLSSGGVNRDAALGVTFTSFFALGVIGVSTVGHGVHLDLECVLYGEIAYIPLDPWIIGEQSYGPRAVWINGGLFLMNLILVLLFYKQYKLCTFDTALAASVGIPVTFFNYLLMSQVAVTVVGAFENVGVILVVAMIIAPAAAAYLLSDRLGSMLVWAVGVGVLSSISGYLFSYWTDCSIAGAMGFASGVLFFLAFLFSPSHGIVIRWWNRIMVKNQVEEEDVILWAGRQWETGTGLSFTRRELNDANVLGYRKTISSLRRLLNSGNITESGGNYSLTERGKEWFRSLIMRHRLYESYLDDLGYPRDHIHDPADRVEHHIPPRVTEAIDKAMKRPEQDPQGKTIPRD